MNRSASATDAFPLAPEGGRMPHSSEPPSGPTTRPWALRFARTPDATNAVRLPASLYDEERQVSIGVDTDLLPYMATHTPSVPDGSITNPPPLDEGPKD
ncbi:putative ATP-grasp-modified RiPP [Streptomyces sp. NBC_00536]|uniref:putative ATP-grasp-modified RiPP n=1 Tax=Streptomyces sp. NBC_00536 TaxID=2975769 RepID=UPI002E807715|nr:putative ATP-grasp-modified RiPP [Streptomyces sp. NBC_00536]WUC80575.1 putative ATP-grasp-modified RiPP [Streptomyces sp. NBC_00536]